MEITTDFDKLGFHDAGIEKIVRSKQTISIELSGVFICREHPQANGKNWLVDNGTLVLFGVENEVAKYWSDSKEPTSHPEPDFPLDEIMHAKYEGGVFQFDGFKETVPWYEWFIFAQGFLLEVEAANEQGS
ncbi:hypothetical protein [Microbulbifer agarilyticus]